LKCEHTPEFSTGPKHNLTKIKRPQNETNFEGETENTTLRYNLSYGTDRARVAASGCSRTEGTRREKSGDGEEGSIEMTSGTWLTPPEAHQSTLSRRDRLKISPPLLHDIISAVQSAFAVRAV
jgi:hypothetical protein